MHEASEPKHETDPRFPSGKWVGFFLQPLIPGKHQMELILNFQQNTITGEGRDWVGEFLIRGEYNLGDGKCHWSKRYVGRHDVFYQGFNEGKGIWGTWEIPASEEYQSQTGGFHIWPEGMSDPTQNRLEEEADEPIIITEYAEDPLAVPIGTEELSNTE